MDKHVFRFRWKVSEVDLGEVELWAEAAIRRAALAGNNPGVYGKGKLTENAGLIVNVPDIDITDAFGRVIEVSSATTPTVDFSTDENSQPTNPPATETRWVLAVIEFLVNATNSQTDPVLGSPFDFHNLDSYKTRIVAGTSTVGTPVPPSVGNGIIIGGVVLSSGQSSIVQAELDSGEDDLLHNTKVMTRGALGKVDTAYMDSTLGDLSAVVTLQELLEIISTKFNDKADKVSGAVAGNFAGLDGTGNLTDSGIEPDDKADRVVPGTTNNIAVLNAIGNLVDGGQTIADIIALIDSSLVPPEAYDSTISGGYPTTFAGGAIQGGHSYRSTTNNPSFRAGAGLNVEDLLIALVDNPGPNTPTNDGDWMVAESNRDQATESTKGVAAVATVAEVNAGTDDNKFITALKLAGSALATAVGLNTAKVTNATHTGDVAGSGVLTIQNDKVGTQHLTHGGGDLVYGTAPGGTPELTKLATDQIADDQITLAKLNGGGSNLVFGTDGSGDPELALLQTEQVADDAVTTAKINNDAVIGKKINITSATLAGPNAVAAGVTATIALPSANSRIYFAWGYVPNEFLHTEFDITSDATTGGPDTLRIKNSDSGSQAAGDIELWYIEW